MLYPDSLFLSIAGLRLKICSDQPLKEDSAFLPFLSEPGEIDFQAVFQQVSALSPFSEDVLWENSSYRVHPDETYGYVRSFFDAPRDFTPYGTSRQNPKTGSILVEYLPKGAHCVSELQNCFFHLGFESLLIHKQRLCLHAACVDTPLGGILFSGVSGIGKSTQADLWCQYRGATLVNGDRPILSKDSTGWLAWGSPYAGSSRCHVNIHCPITAIVMLKQDTVCSLRRLPISEAFRAVWSGLTVYSWNAQLLEMASNLAIDLVSTVPVFELACTPDLQAVECLEQGLRKECCL